MKNNKLGSSSPSLAELQYQSLHRDDNKGSTLIVIAAVLTATATVAVILRLIARRTIKRPLNIDDFAIIVALVIYR
jgi:hypothetical protein